VKNARLGDEKAINPPSSKRPVSFRRNPFPYSEKGIRSRYGWMHQCLHFFRKRRYFRPRGTASIALDKGKSLSRSRNRP
jgi:hypothetical protein